MDRFYRKVGGQWQTGGGADPLPGVTGATSEATRGKEWFWEQILVNGSIVVPPDKVFPEWSANITMDGK